MTGLTISNVLAVLLVLFVAWMALACAWSCRDKNRTGAGRIRCFARLAWYRITRRMPRYQGRPEPDRKLSAAEFRTFAEIVRADHRREPYAHDPMRDRGRSQ